MSVFDEVWTPELQALADELSLRASISVETIRKNYDNMSEPYSGDAGDETE